MAAPDAAPTTVPGAGIATAPIEPELTLEEAPIAVAASTGPPKTAVVVNTAQELQAALRHSTQHIEIQSHFALYDETTYSALHPERTRDPAVTDGWDWHLHPSLDFVINAHLQVPASVRSIRVRYITAFDALLRFPVLRSMAWQHAASPRAGRLHLWQADCTCGRQISRAQARVCEASACECRATAQILSMQHWTTSQLLHRACKSGAGSACCCATGTPSTRTTQPSLTSCRSFQSDQARPRRHA